jgi:hypothetical protein
LAAKSFGKKSLGGVESEVYLPPVKLALGKRIIRILLSEA